MHTATASAHPAPREYVTEPGALDDIVIPAFFTRRPHAGMPLQPLESTMNASLAPTPPAAIGTPWEGGFFGGKILLAGVSFAVVWAPKAEGETLGAWLPERKAVDGTNSCGDSITNTLAMADAGSALALWALDLRINGQDDWCLPARDVLELAYRHLKPTTEATDAYFRDGDNPSSDPVGYPYASGAAVVQTSVADFQAGGAQAFEPGWYWASTQYSDADAWTQHFANGNQGYNGKSFKAHARAVRLIQLTA